MVVSSSLSFAEAPIQPDSAPFLVWSDRITVPAFQGIFNILSQTADSGLVYGIAVIDRLQNIDRQIQETVEDLAQSRVCQAR